jgi:hypothetical protein
MIEMILLASDSPRSPLRTSSRSMSNPMAVRSQQSPGQAYETIGCSLIA